MMPVAYAGRICKTHVRAAYARTDGRTNGKDGEVQDSHSNLLVSQRARAKAVNEQHVAIPVDNGLNYV